MGTYSDYQKSNYLRRSGHDGRIRASAGIKVDDKLNIPVIAEGPYEGVPALADYKSYFMEYWNDFLSVNDFSVDETGTAVDWLFTVEQETGTSGAQDLVTDTQFGIIRLTNDSADNDAVSLQYTGAASAGEFVTLTADKIVVFETRVKLSAATQIDAFAGLAISDTTLAAAASAIPSATDYVGFAKDDGDTNWDFVTAKDYTGTEEAESAGVVTATTDWVTLAFRVDGVSSITPFYKDSNNHWQRGTPQTTYICDDTAMCISYAVRNGDANARTMDIDYVRVLQQR